MFGFKNLAYASAALFLAAPAAVAQATLNYTQLQVRDCAASVRMPDFPELAYYFDVSDTTQFSTRYTYNYDLCKGIPVAGVTLTDSAAGTTVTCTYQQFTTGQVFTALCQTTRGAMATASLSAGPPGVDFYTTMRLGVRPTFYTREDIFTVVGEDATTTMVSSTTAAVTSPVSTTAATTTTAPPTVSEMFRRRRRAMETGEIVLSSAVMCDAGKTACLMRDRKHWFTKCIDTTSELYACGGCPGSDGAQDCSELKGVADVECVRGTCQINQCDRSHKLASDGRTCVPKEAYHKRSFW